MSVDEDLQALGDHIVASMPGAATGSVVRLGELTVSAQASEIAALITFLRDDPRCLFQTLIDLCGVDYPARAQRFDVVYHLLSMKLNRRVRVIIHTDEATPISSIASLHPCAEWFEREAFDMYGVLFAGMTDLRRLLTDYGFQGHPLRKDFPMSGHVELRYDVEQERVVYEPVKLSQAYRHFDTLSPWEGMTQAAPGDEKAARPDQAG